MDVDSLLCKSLRTPLIEIVSEPNLRSAKDASRYLVKVRQIVTYLEICDGNMEKEVYCDANVLSEKGKTKLNESQIKIEFVPHVERNE